MSRSTFGVIGLGTMGRNLALNIEDHGYSVALWTRTEAKVERFIEKNGARPAPMSPLSAHHVPA